MGHLFLITSLRAPKGRGNPDLIYFSSFSAVSFLAMMCTFATLKYQMLGSVISMQAWLRLSPYAFVLSRNYCKSLRAASSFAIISLCVASLVRSAFTTASGAPETNFWLESFFSIEAANALAFSICTSCQMLASAMPKQAWARLSTYAFVLFEAGDFCSRVEDTFERDVKFATGHHGAGAELRLHGLHGDAQVRKARKFGDDCHAVLHACFRRGVVHAHHDAQLGGGAYVVAATHATHAFHHGKCLVECGFDLCVNERFVGLGPCAADHHFAALEQNAVEFFGNERHHRVEQVKHVLQHVAEDSHRVLLFGGEGLAVDHGLLDLRKRQMLASVMPTQAWSRLSSYAFVQVAGADSAASSHTKRYRNPASSAKWYSSSMRVASLMVVCRRERIHLSSRANKFLSIGSSAARAPACSSCG